MAPIEGKTQYSVEHLGYTTASPARFPRCGPGDARCKLHAINTISQMRDSTVRRLSRIHRRLFRLSRGKVGRRLVGNDMLLLTTQGRRSGRWHEVPLLYLRDGERLLVIASYGGRPHHPDWYLNLIENPKVQVQIGDRRRSMTSRLADKAERAIWWPKVVEAYSAYEEYQSRTARPIPLVFLQP